MCAVPVSGELPRSGRALPGSLNSGPEGFPRLPWNEGLKGKRGRASQVAPWPGASLSGTGKSCAPVSTVEYAASRGLLPSSLAGQVASEWVPAGRGGVRALQLSPAPGSLAWPSSYYFLSPHLEHVTNSLQNLPGKGQSRNADCPP